MRVWRSVILSLLFLFASSVALEAAQLTPEQTMKRRQLYDLRLSPDGSRIALTVSEPVEGTEQNRDIWVFDIKSRHLRKFTTSPKSDTRPRWSPDGKTLAFLSGRSKTTQIYILSMLGGEAEALTETKTAIRAFEWSPEGKQIAYLATEPETEEEEKRKKDKNDARVVDLDDKHPQLWILDVESREVRQLTYGKWRISEFSWVPQGDHLVISATDHPQPELFTNRIYTVQVSDGEMKLVSSPCGSFHSLKVSTDGKFIAYVGARVDAPIARDIYLHPIPDGQPQNLTNLSIDRQIRSFFWRKDRSLLALVQAGFNSTFYAITQDGKAEKLEGFDVSPSSSFVVDPGLLAFVGQSATKAPELWISPRPGHAEQVSHLNKEWDEIVLTKPEMFCYSSFDGTEIEAALLKPAGYKEGSRVPLLVLIHGGPSGVWSNRFEAWGQMLAARGFAVLYPNIRGSIGYGNAFLEMNRRDWGGGDFKDVMAGVDFLIKQGIADPERLGIGGWSYGGYMAAWAVTQTPRFKAAVSGAPMTDLASEYGTESSSINSYDTWYLGTPYENLDLFIERSPVTHVKNVRTPTLILCGEKDTTDPIGQCQQFYRGLKRYGVKNEFVIYPREGHGIREEKHRIDLLNRVLDWFEKYLRGEISP